MSKSNRAVLKELAKRQIEEKKRLEKPQFRVEEFCFPQQIAFIRDPAKFKTAVCSRRAGKTLSCAADLIETCLTFPNVNVAYITLSRRSAKKIIWKDLRAIIKQFELAVKEDNVDLSMTFENGSTIYVSGATDESDVEKYRGMNFKKVYIDEVQSFPGYIEYLVDEVIVPALYDYDGSLILTGTPGPVPAGYFYDCAHSKGWSNHKWTILDNPFIKIKSGKEPAEILKAERERRGVDETDPKYLRESLGLWVYDENSLVFKFSKDKNVYQKLPDAQYDYIFGIDIGYDDADAIAVLAYSAHDPCVYLVEEHIQSKQTISDLVNQIRILQEKYKPVKMVMDAGALGKKIQEEILQRHQLYIHAAEKQRKLEFIELMNDDLRTAKFKAFAGSRFEQDAFKVEWDRTNPEKPRISDVFHSDSCFVAGTLIATPTGQIPIEFIKAGDVVLTSHGEQEVEWAAKTHDLKEVCKLSFSDGKSVICTLDHPIYTKNRGFVAAKDLTCEDKLITLDLWEKTKERASHEKQLHSMDANSTATHTPRERILGITLAAFGEIRKSCYTEQHGSSTLETFQRDTSFTTKTEIPSITTFQTWNVYHQNSILGSTNTEKLRKLVRSIWRRLDHWLHYGIVQKLAGLGTSLTMQRILPTSLLKSRALSAPNSLRDVNSDQKNDLSALTPASLGTDDLAESTMSTELVSGANVNFHATSTLSKDFAVALVTREILTQKEAVYNLKVSKIPEYFANGILVHNCDSTLYAWRECRHYSSKPAPFVPKFGTDAYMKQLEEREAAKMEESKRKTGMEDILGSQEDLDSLVEPDSIFDFYDSDDEF